MKDSLRQPAIETSSTHGFALPGALLSLLVQRKLGKETHPDIRVSLRSTPLLPVPLRGPAYKGRPCPFKPLAASMRLVPLRNTSTRPADGEFARMKVSRFRPDGVVGSLHRTRIVPTLCVGMQLQTLRVCGTQSVPGGVPTRSVGTIKRHLRLIHQQRPWWATLRGCPPYESVRDRAHAERGDHQDRIKRPCHTITSTSKARAGTGSRQEASGIVV